MWPCASSSPVADAAGVPVAGSDAHGGLVCVRASCRALLSIQRSWTSSSGLQLAGDAGMAAQDFSSGSKTGTTDSSAGTCVLHLTASEPSFIASSAGQTKCLKRGSGRGRCGRQQHHTATPSGLQRSIAQSINAGESVARGGDAAQRDASVGAVRTAEPLAGVSSSSAPVAKCSNTSGDWESYSRGVCGRDMTGWGVSLEARHRGRATGECWPALALPEAGGCLLSYRCSGNGCMGA